VVTVPLGDGTSASALERAIYSVISVIELAAESVHPFRNSMFGMRQHADPEHRGLARSHITIHSAEYGPDLEVVMTADWVHGHSREIAAAAIVVTHELEAAARSLTAVSVARSHDEEVTVRETTLRDLRAAIAHELRVHSPLSLSIHGYLPEEVDRIVDPQLVLDVGAHAATYVAGGR
jgi:hypothetical protein